MSSIHKLTAGDNLLIIIGRGSIPGVTISLHSDSIVIVAMHCCCSSILRWYSKTLLSSPNMPSYGHPFLSVVFVPGVNFQQTHAFTSTTNIACAFTYPASSFLSTCPCHLSLYLLITSPIAFTPRCLLSSVVGCLSWKYYTST